MQGSWQYRLLRGVAIVSLAMVVFGEVTLADTLKGAMLKAYRTNPTLQAARAEQRGTDENVPQAKSGWRPVITGQGRVSKTWTESETLGSPSPPTQTESNARSLSIQLSQPLFRGFKTVEGVKQAKAIVKAGRQRLLSIEQDLLLNVADAYLSVIRDRSVLAQRERNVSNLRKQENATSARFEAGEVTRTDVSQARARVSGSLASLASAKASLASSTARYENAVGAKPGKLSAPNAAKVPHSLEEALAIARETNPRILAAEQNRHASEHAINVTKGDLLPSASLNADGTLSYRKGPGSFGGESETVSKSVSIEGVLNVPIYEGGRVYSAVREAKQLESQRQLEVISAGRTVRQGVKIAWNDMLASQEAITAAQAQVRAAQLSVEGVRQEYLVGSRSTIDVLNAEQELVNARVTLINAQYSYTLSSYEVLASMGRLTARRLALGGPYYDPEEHYDSVKNKWIGLEADTLQ